MPSPLHRYARTRALAAPDSPSPLQRATAARDEIAMTDQEQDWARTVHVVTQPDTSNVRIRPIDTKALAHTMGLFGPARYVKSAHAYDVPAHLWDTFRTFAQVHAITIADEPERPVRLDTAQAHMLREVAETRARLGTPEARAAQAETNRRGLLLCRLALDIANRKRRRTKEDRASA